MKILRISGKNLASLAGEFCVDFEAEPLASSGLFAISGPTGAGKSTLLDALCLALYDATPRLLKGGRGASVLPDVGEDTVSVFDPRTLLRRGAAEAWAEVDFAGNDQRRYRARWSVRRSRGKAGGALQKSALTLHALPELAPIGGTKTEVAAEIAARVGLSFEQFTRAVLLAQNEFSAFLKTDENERGELLETLTGSAVYSEISKRAFERYKSEQEATRLLAAQLASQAPLDGEARAALDAERAAAELALEALDARKAVLERQARWHDELARLRQSEALAQEALADAEARGEAALGPRRRLAQLDAVQGARPLMADAARLDGEQAAARAAMENAERELAQVLQAQHQGALALEAAGAALATAELAQRQAAPGLDEAKALDATLAALAGAHTQARAAREAARNEWRQAQAAQHDQDTRLGAARAAQQDAADWLAAHREREALALQWQLWDKLLTQAGQAAQADAQLAAELAAATVAARDAAQKDAQCAGAATAASTRLDEFQAERRRASTALAEFDADALHVERQAIELRREQLARAEQTWTALAAARSRQDELERQSGQLEQSRGAARRALEQALADAGALAGAAAQAERSLGAAELACADSVEDLRANLAEGQPCPVCGSAEHPYQHQDARLHALLDGLRAELARCRDQVSGNLAAQAAQRAAAASADERLTVLAAERAALAQTLAQLVPAWDAQPLARQAPQEERGAWFASQLAELKQAAWVLEAREQAARKATLERDAAQRRCDQAQAEHAQLQQLAVQARAALARAEAEHSALETRREAARELLAGLLSELDPALAEACGSRWQDEWRADPPAYRAARAAEASAWSEQSALQARLAATIATLEAELAAALARSAHAERIATAANTSFEQLDANFGARQGQRAALWDGRPVREVEQALAASVAGARGALAAQQEAAIHAAQAEARVRAALAQLGERSAALRAAAAQARQQLEDWLSAFPERHPGLDVVAGLDALAALLAVGEAQIARERAALGALDAAAASAVTVLAERRSQREQHQHGAPAKLPAEAVTAALEALLAERRAAADLAGALRLRAAQDDERRARAQAVLGEIEKQRAVEQRWGRLSDLIGSADGKKFRNYAQQFTLDVLLGYANSHLAQLARRYRLERVVHPAGPSLALMVRDQDMGGEVRSVNSLSGGESFLVSLALALGLASLSSNRVRVESLFIDEGFGSLDSDTLAVAMDALDALQSLGRKVGVISHVHEMAERIATRITVRPAGGGSSVVSVA
jgi:DNA repair protein SbcC/Rad50